MRWAWLLMCALAAGAHAEPPITDRDYAIDFYEGTALGNTRQVGMGGAGIALIPGSAGALLNPSAPAVRDTTDRDAWSWDYHLDYLSGRYSSDYDNNGVVLDEGGGAQLFTGGLALRVGEWAGALTTTIQSAPLGGADELVARAQRVKLALARWVPRIDTAIGIAAHGVAFQIAHAGDTVFDLGAGGVDVGATWVPRLQAFRVGVAVASAILGGTVHAAGCDPAMCMIGDATYILPSQVASGARLGLGGAYRFGPTAWNQLVPTRFRDERSLTLAADLWITGPTSNGHGIEKFGMQELQRSGATTNVGARLGAEVEALPGRLRLRAGTYWEPARFANTTGRIHGTFGVEVRVFEFPLWGVRRGRLGVTADVAARYRNVALSIGFWH